jgi:hypothetical protein
MRRNTTKNGDKNKTHMKKNNDPTIDRKDLLIESAFPGTPAPFGLEMIWTGDLGLNAVSGLSSPLRRKRRGVFGGLVGGSES